MYQLTFFVPDSHAEEVKEALFKKGAGQYENYRRCSWQVPGEGQFQPMEGSNPFIGSIGSLEKVKEFRVEMICKDAILREVLAELLRVHPYDEPAYYAVKIER
ncbi:MAG: NGG1p interacting factor NIF3 [bacterium]|nr:NGG1p interacting factor NIF3 [bacterium]